MEEKKNIKITGKTFILILVFVIVLTILATYTITTNFITGNKENLNEVNLNEEYLNEPVLENITSEGSEEIEETEISTVKDYEQSMFDLIFLKLENQKENKIYSPLSIKYALKMLEDGANGETKNQITNVLGDVNLTKYTSNKNFSFANSFFIRDSYKTNIKNDFIDNLKNKYNAEVRFDDFKNSNNINSWIKEKTLDIIPNIVQDEDVKELDFALINALAIDMEWNEKFLCVNNGKGYEIAKFNHEQIPFDDSIEWEERYLKGINVNGVENVSSTIFNNGKEELKISGMNIFATINNYNIIEDLGEDYIKKTVTDEYRKFAKDEEYDDKHAFGDFPLSDDASDAGIQKALDEFFPQYFEDLKNNYHKLGTTTSFSIYTDDDVKVFAKDLKEYNGTKLQYIGIMPKKEDLDAFVKNIDNDKINNYISNSKNVEDYKDFKEGVVTRIYGYIPKFNFEYDLDLLEDLKKVGITYVFDGNKADLSNMVEGPAYIKNALHKANIEFTQDGIKAAAATLFGGLGAGIPFDYEFDVPYEYIDMTFDKPFMFLIKDKETEEIWFTGTVYNPLLWESEPESHY